MRSSGKTGRPWLAARSGDAVADHPRAGSTGNTGSTGNAGNGLFRAELAAGGGRAHHGFAGLSSVGRAPCVTHSRALTGRPDSGACAHPTTCTRTIANTCATPAPTPTPVPTPDPSPQQPDWLGKSTQAVRPVDLPAMPRQVEAAPLEWRPLPWAAGWEGYGRDIDGKFMITTWRKAQAPATAAPAPVLFRLLRVLFQAPYCPDGLAQ